MPSTPPGMIDPRGSAGNVIGMHRLGGVYRRQGRVEDAEGWYRRAADAGSTPSMHLLGRLYEEQGRAAEVQEWLRRGEEER